LVNQVEESTCFPPSWDYQITLFHNNVMAYLEYNWFENIEHCMFTISIVLNTH
jgi:cytochrome b